MDSYNTPARQPVPDVKALVVFESMFGNTEAIARAVAAGLTEHVTTQVVDVTRVPNVPDTVELLVAGGPTHAFGLSRPKTRQTARDDGGRMKAAAGIGLREWLAAMRTFRAGLAVATFDTKIMRPPMPGSAARAARRRLHRLGAKAVARPESFYVNSTTGPLVDGELERARAWGFDLGARLRAKQHDHAV